MPLPVDLREKLARKNPDVTVTLKPPQGDRAVIEGKTSISFGAFVRLILQKKVQGILKDWQGEPVIISSDLLTKIASAPGDTAEDKSKVILTALVIGICGGFFIAASGIVILGMMGITIGQKELLVALTVLLVVAAAVFGALQIHTRKIRDQFIEKIERVSDIFSR